MNQKKIKFCSKSHLWIAKQQMGLSNKSRLIAIKDGLVNLHQIKDVYPVNFLKTQRLKSRGTRGVETGGAEAELMLAIFCCLGRSTMRYCLKGGGVEG